MSENADIYLHRQFNIKKFFNIVNTILKYIEVVALYLDTIINSNNQYDKDKIKIDVSNKIKAAIDDSKEYKSVLVAYDKENNTNNDVNSVNIHQSIYICFYDLLKIYNLEGGRKRTVGRPRKTPIMKHSAKTTAKPIKKPTTKPTKKPTKPVAKKPTKK